MKKNTNSQDICKFSEAGSKNNKASERLISKITPSMLKEVVSNIKNLPQKTKYQYTMENILSRFQMLKWIENLCLYLNLSDDTFFTTIEIYDEVLKKFSYNLSNDDFILIGLTCIFISCKLHDGKTINIDFLLKTIAHEKFERDDLLMTELLILKTLGFKLPRNYFLSFVNCILGLILPTLDGLISDQIYLNIVNIYKKILCDSKYEKYDFMMIYTSVVYYVLNKMDICSNIKLNEIIAKMAKVVKMYKVNWKRSVLIANVFEQDRL